VTDDIKDLQKHMQRIEIKVEQVLTELQPICKLHRGNGKPGLDVRMSVAESELDDVKSSTQWAFRTAVTAIIGALSSVVLYLLKK
tara:strand:- start:6837 stop:7091 length:255 start_codon:yes stop_codon:yes gene_type:complete